MANYAISTDNMTSHVNEVWLPIPDYEGMYEVSNMGRVKSLDRAIGKRLIKGKLIQPSLDGSGYPQFQLCRNNGRRMVKVHKMVSMLFCKKADGKNEVNHKNFDKTDNRACNLEWVSHQENIAHFKATGGYTSAVNPSRKKKLSVMDVIELRKAKANGVSTSELAEKFNLSKVNVWAICKNKYHVNVSGVSNG